MRATDGVRLIESNPSRWGLEWKNSDRLSGDWKVKLFEQTGSRRQLAIYARKTITIVRVEEPVLGVAGTAPHNLLKGDALEANFSNFKGRKGLCYAVEDLTALQRFLDVYFQTLDEPSSGGSSSPEPKSTGLSSLEEVTSEFEHAVQKARIEGADERQKRLAAARRKPPKRTVSCMVFERNPDVVAEVLERANGVCGACGSNAPFKKATTGVPYLEVHHRVRLADDGEDSVENAIATCPNCHRRLHYG